jgi:hypothetical protein
LVIVLFWILKQKTPHLLATFWIIRRRNLQSFCPACRLQAFDTKFGKILANTVPRGKVRREGKFTPESHRVESHWGKALNTLETPLLNVGRSGGRRGGRSVVDVLGHGRRTCA